ncbi:MAG: transketolase C-terminal domain-containing protein, partial [Candidatus Nanopelagicales bacterium]|nr:transketolase C-terminal domain-containing protein [Candidatus Nanopelagicales bacterium]
ARSYAPTIGGLADHLASLRTTPGYDRMLDWGKRMLPRTPVVGSIAYGAFHGFKKGIKDVLAPQGLFEDLGLKYLGPVDGHDIAAVRHALRLARRYPGPVIVHALTEKGHGYPPAEADDGDRFHGISAIDPATGKSVGASCATWTSVFAEEIERLAAENPRLVGITAAMREPVGLGPFARRFPDRVFDVGIAEQHAVTSACGMAFAGLHPVVALYATFLNRAFDQLLLDAALHRAPVTFVLDRAGVTGEDGASHHGVWDLALSGIVPGLRVAAPRDGTRLRELLAEAIDCEDAPTLVRFPKGGLPEDIETCSRIGRLDVIAGNNAAEVLLVAVGATAASCVEAARILSGQGIGVAVVDPRWVQPISPELIALARDHELVVTVEDGIRADGAGSLLSHELRRSGSSTVCVELGLPCEFIEQGCRADLLAEAGLDPEGIAGEVRNRLESR